MEEIKKCKNCEFKEMHPNRKTGEKTLVCCCFPLCRVIEDLEIQPDWCPLKE